MNRPRTWQKCDSKTLQSCLKYWKPSARSLLDPGQSEWQFPSPGARLWCCWDVCTITFLADRHHLIGFIICSTPEKLRSSFPNFIYHEADREQSHLYVPFTASGLWSKADLRTYSHPSSPLAQPRSLLDEYASKRELGKGPVLAWERIFKAKSTWGSDLAFIGSWCLSSLWCFWNPQIFKCTPSWLPTQNAAQLQKLRPIFILLHNLPLHFSPFRSSVDVRGQSSILLLFQAYFK